MEEKFEKPMTENEKINGNKLYRFLMSRDVVTKEEMFEFLGWEKSKDRQLRSLLAFIGKKVPLISTSDSRGYKIAKTKYDLGEVEHQWAEMSKRIEELQKRIEPLIKFREKFKFGGEYGS